MATVVVTGGAGFIGCHLCEFLLEKGYRVICVDNLFTGKKENIKHLFDNKNFEFIEHDIIEPLHLIERVDQVYNLACPASPVHYQHDGIRTIKANTIGVINMLGLAKKHNARILQASTSEVYGDPEVHPQVESYRGCVNTLGLRSCYDEGKRVAESLFFEYHRNHGVEIRIARIFNTYGPRMSANDGRVVSNFILQSLNGEDITVFGDGSQTRSFCYVSDLVRGLFLLMESDFMGPVNLGNPVEITIKEAAEEIVALTGSKSKIVYKELPQDDPKIRCPDISLAKSKLDWEPKIPRSEGFKKTIEYFSS